MEASAALRNACLLLVLSFVAASCCETEENRACNCCIKYGGTPSGSGTQSDPSYCTGTGLAEGNRLKCVKTQGEWSCGCQQWVDGEGWVNSYTCAEAHENIIAVQTCALNEETTGDDPNCRQGCT